MKGFETSEDAMDRTIEKNIKLAEVIQDTFLKFQEIAKWGNIITFIALRVF